MSENVIGNLLVAQSGGPTSVINATLAGVVTEALNYEDQICEIYGGRNGIQGVFNEDFVNLAEESQLVIRGLRYTPGPALGSCRFKLKREEEYARLLEIFKAHDIKYFLYIGGNDSQDTSLKIHQAAQAKGMDLKVIGLPKTMDNDLPMTDHCPGYGSVIKYVASTVRELACDHEGMGNHDLVSIVEVMGRTAGWVAAGASLAKRKDHPTDAPHIILLPEVAFSAQKFVEDVKNVLKTEKYCMVIAPEGLVDEAGNYVTASTKTDAFGHVAFGGGGNAEYLKDLIEKATGISAKITKLGYAQRCAAHCSSKTDNDEAFAVGVAGVKAAVAGESGKMVTLQRADSNEYKSETGLVPLEEVANKVKSFPAQWINDDGISLNFQFNKYAAPLINGEVQVPYENGLPALVRISAASVEKKATSEASI
jgi:ATP-dependent phosphofructokinase / diphosphate-dependent phosphofructokinase